MAEHQFKGRREDARLVSGHGRYTDDCHFDDEAKASFVRSDRAHAKIVRIDTVKARALAGVLDILTGADLVAAGWKGMPVTSFFKGVGGSSLRVPFRTGLAHERTRFVGEPVAVVVAESEDVAQDAAELVEVEYEDLPVFVDASDALAKGAAVLHQDMPDNLAFEYEYGNKQAAAIFQYPASLANDAQLMKSVDLSLKTFGVGADAAHKRIALNARRQFKR